MNQDMKVAKGMTQNFEQTSFLVENTIHERMNHIGEQENETFRKQILEVLKSWDCVVEGEEPSKASEQEVLTKKSNKDPNWKQQHD